MDSKCGYKSYNHLYTGQLGQPHSGDLLTELFFGSFLSVTIRGMILKAEAFQLPSVCHEVQRHGYATDLGMAATQIPWVKHGGFTIQKTALIADVE